MDELEKVKATADFWQRTALDQQKLKEKAEKDRDEVREKYANLNGDMLGLQEQLSLSVEVIKQWNTNYDSLFSNYKAIVNENDQLRKDVVAQFERYQLLECKYRAAQNEIENGQLERFNVDMHGNVTRIVDLGKEGDK